MWTLYGLSADLPMSPQTIEGPKNGGSQILENAKNVVSIQSYFAMWVAIASETQIAVSILFSVILI